MEYLANLNSNSMQHWQQEGNCNYLHHPTDWILWPNQMEVEIDLVPVLKAKWLADLKLNCNTVLWNPDLWNCCPKNLYPNLPHTQLTGSWQGVRRDQNCFHWSLGCVQNFNEFPSQTSCLVLTQNCQQEANSRHPHHHWNWDLKIIRVLCWNQIGVGRKLVPVLVAKSLKDLKLNQQQLKSNTMM